MKLNCTLQNLIHNYFWGTKFNSEYIDGPYTLSLQYSKKYNKTIYIFGETHGFQRQCKEVYPNSSSVTIVEYLNELFNNTDVFIDFYLETVPSSGYKLKTKHMFSFSEGSASILNRIRWEYEKCLDPKQWNDCQLNTIRAHFVDLREDTKIKPKPQNIMEKMTVDIGVLESKKLTKTIIKRFFKKYKTLIKKIRSLKSRTEITDFYIKFLKSIPMLTKEIKRSDLDEDTVYKLAKKVYYKRYSKDTLKEINYSIPDDDSFKEWDYALWYIDRVVQKMQVGLVDVYTLVRTFKTFRKTKRHQPQEISNIIYYFGNAHATNLRLYLKLLGFNRLNTIKSGSGKKTQRCLKMRDFPQPFFE